MEIKEFIYQFGGKERNSQHLYKIFILGLLNFIGARELHSITNKILKDIRGINKFAVDLTLEEIGKLFTVTENPLLNFGWALMAFDGLRPGEVLGLFYEDVDAEKKTVTLKKREGLKYGPKAKTEMDDPAIIPLNEIAVKYFLEIKKLFLENLQHGRILTISYKTLRLKWIESIRLVNWKKRDYPFTMHKLRHFFGHYWNEQTKTKKRGDIRVLKEIMRHSKLEYTLIYTQPTSKKITQEFHEVMALKP